MNTNLSSLTDTIAAIATPQGTGAIGVIRISGPKTFDILNRIFPSKDLLLQPSHTLHVGYLTYNDEKIDEVVLSLYRGPKSYTGEDIIEISCHGSPFIQQKILELLFTLGARPAKAGEFTQRAFLNGKMDLSQAEAVADLISAESEAVHKTALQQMKGGFSNDIKKLRSHLIEFAALIELELDFSDEDVEFADRKDLKKLIDEILSAIKKLIHSFKQGNIMKHGVVTVIAGRPNAGKSTLLNALLNEERAIVTDIAGTTRDLIEEKLVAGGIVFRLIDTAGIREAQDVVEKIGIEKTFEKINDATILIYVFDASSAGVHEVAGDIKQLHVNNQQVLIAANKTDKCTPGHLDILRVELNKLLEDNYPFFEISAINKTQTDALKEFLPSLVLDEKIDTGQTIVVNTRHFASLTNCEQSLEKVSEGLDKNITGDILALDIRHALHALGEITGEILHDRDILGTIFGKFCIGK